MRDTPLNTDGRSTSHITTFDDEQFAHDLAESIGHNSDGDDELYIDTILDEETIARLDAVFNARVQGATRKGKKARRPASRLGVLREMDFQTVELVIEDVDNKAVYRIGKALVPARLWDSLEIGELVDFDADPKDAAKALRICRHVTSY